MGCVAYWANIGVDVDVKVNGRLTITAHILLEVSNLRKRGVLSASAQEIAEAVQGDAAIASLVKQRECLLVVGRSLVTFVISGHVGQFLEKIFQLHEIV